MARIRSVHPTLFTDEAWVGCSPVARLLYIGLWTDADDQGLFEWKPLQIKMRLLPGDDLDATALLAELAAAGLIRPFEASGRPYGAIRNFRSFQRPKKPNAVHPLPDALRPYVGLSEPAAPAPGFSPEADLFPHPFGTGAELSPQMEDGGWRRREGEETSPDGESVLAPVPARGASAAVPSPSPLRGGPGWGEASGRSAALSTAHPREGGDPDSSTDAGGSNAPYPDASPHPNPPLEGEGASSAPDPIQQAFDAWNTLAARLDLPAARRLDAARRRAIRARLADGGPPAWAQALQAVEHSPFLRGQTERPFRADLDFVCQPKSWRRLLEGFYGPAPGKSETAPPARPWTGPPDLRAAAVAAKGERWAVSYLDPCLWRAEPRALVPANAHAARVLAAELGAVLRRLGVALDPVQPAPAQTIRSPSQ